MNRSGGSTEYMWHNFKNNQKWDTPLVQLIADMLKVVPSVNSSRVLRILLFLYQYFGHLLQVCHLTLIKSLEHLFIISGSSYS